MTDPDDDRLSRWLFETFFFDDDEVPTNTGEAAEIAAQLAEVHRRAQASSSRARRRRRHIAGGGLALVVLAGGGLGAAALLRSEQPSHPQAGVVCRQTPQRATLMIVVSREVDDDPIELCADVWRSGRLGDVGEIPPLIACVGDGGAVEVMPGDDTTCESLGLAHADLELSDDARRIVELQERIVDEINLAECRPTEAVRAKAQQILDDLGLTRWTITTNDDAATSTCANIAVDPPSETLNILNLP